MSDTTLPAYLRALDKQYRTGIAREHAYRGDLQQLLGSLCPGVLVTNEPARIACGAPDYILTRKDIPVGYVEAKDIGVDLGSKRLKEQFDRYRGSLDNLITTDYLEFRFFRNGEPTTTVRVGEVVNGGIEPLPENFDKFSALITDFAGWQGQTITSPASLATMMAGKARLLADVIEMAVSSDVRSQANTELKEQLEAFKTVLIHDIAPKSFADLYAQTITYGMFAARLHDSTPDSFSRVEAAQLIPKSNPFLRKLFQSISGYDLDERVAWIVDALADVFRATDVGKLLSGFGKGSGREDAFMHFYEDFLAQYDPKLRRSRGVWYTPDAVVRFIVRAVDNVLQAEFGISEGLADSSTVEVTRTIHKKATPDRRSKGKEIEIEERVHRVQVLDPAAGTGTFLAEIVRQIHGKFEGQQGVWSEYVNRHLIPRLNGFELLMASYAMAHLKLDIVLRETGYDMSRTSSSARETGLASDRQRLRVFLTNSLEEAHPDTGTLFANWLSQEAKEANVVKRDTPVMVVLGNPPYSVSSSNKGAWIQSAIQDYKDGLDERKMNLDDDYIKFIRYGQYLIDKTGEGILAFISNNSYLDGITQRRMRELLLNSFSSIYILNLHGDSNKKETAPGGGKDENIFDIKQGVAITIFVKNPRSTKPQVKYLDLYGKREEKYSTLLSASLAEVEWTRLEPAEPYFYFVPKDYGLVHAYDQGFSLDELFSNYSTGIQTKRDALCVQIDSEALTEIEHDFATLKPEDIREKYSLVKDNRDWQVAMAQADLKKNSPRTVPVAYRPFDTRFTLYTGESKGFLGYPRHKVMRHMLRGPNLALLFGRQNKSDRFDSVLACNSISEMKCAERTIQSYQAPLYLYPKSMRQVSTTPEAVRPNLNLKLLEEMSIGLDLTYTSGVDDLFEHGVGDELRPLDVFDYCYAVLHSPHYRATYGELLKSDFPRVPFPTDVKKFRALVRLGARLRALHLLESKQVDTFITTYPVTGNNEVSRRVTSRSPGWEETGSGRGRVWINDLQHFDNVPEVAWNFYIGGYQPAQKWLKDRRGRTLGFGDIRHYQRMIVALKETEEVMREVDEVGVV